MHSSYSATSTDKSEDYKILNFYFLEALKMRRRNFTAGYQVFHQLQKIRNSEDKQAFTRCANAIMSYRETNQNTTEFQIGKVLKLLRSNNYSEAHEYFSNWLKENDENYDGENWYGETYQ